MKIEDLGIAILSSHPIAFHPILAEIGGGATEGLFMSQLLYWRGKEQDSEGWLYKSLEEWKRETCLNRHEIDRARAAWKKLGVLEEKREGVHNRLFYRLDADRLRELLQSSLPTLAKYSANPGKVPCQSWQTLNTEITTETTTETTSRSSQNKQRSERNAERGSAPVPGAVAQKEQEDDPPLEEIKSSKLPGPPLAAQNILRRAVREHFCKRTGLRLPGGAGESHRREVATLWWGPIREICDLAGWDERRALRLVDEALKEMEGLTVSDPHSIIKVCRAVAARGHQEERAFEAVLDRIRRRSEQDRIDSEERERRRHEYRRQQGQAG